MSNKINKKKVLLRIENVVATIKIAETINLAMLSGKYSDIQEKRGFPGIMVRIKKPKATILIFESGKLVLTGVRLETDIPIILEKIKSRFTEAGISLIENAEYTVQNIVVKGNYHASLNLDLLTLSLDSAIYEPEIFPGVIYRVHDPKMSFLFFSSGKFIVTGVKSEADLIPTVKSVSKKLRSFGAFKVVSTSDDPISLNLLELAK